MLSAAANKIGVLGSVFRVNLGITRAHQMQKPAPDKSALFPTVRKRDPHTHLSIRCRWMWAYLPTQILYAELPGDGFWQFGSKFFSYCYNSRCLCWSHMNRELKTLETSCGREMAIQAALVDVPAASRPITRSPRSAPRYATTVSGMDLLGRGDMLTNAPLDRFVNNIWEKWEFEVDRKSLRSLSSSDAERWEQKQRCCFFRFGFIKDGYKISRQRCAGPPLALLLEVGQSRRPRRMERGGEEQR